MNRSLGLLIASSLAGALIGACTAGPDAGGLTGSRYANGGYASGPSGGATTTSPGDQPTSDGGAAATGTGDTTPTTGDTPAVAPPPDAGPGSVESAAHLFFNGTVYPELAVCQACHSTAADGAPKMMDSPADTTYSELDARGLIQSSSLLLTKGSHDSGKAPTLTPQMQTDITQWLSMEAQERQGQAAPTNILAAIAGCVDETEWNAIKWGTLLTQARSTENPNKCTDCNKAQCVSCHESGEMGFYMAEGSPLEPAGTTFKQTFQGSKSSTYIIKYFGLNGATPVPSDAILTKMQAVAAGPAYSHPMFVMSQTMQDALNTFVNDAITRYTSGACGSDAGAPDAGTD
jgi:hypothetical protein